MAINDLWTKAQRIAWDYIKSYSNSGINQTQALKSYREAGMGIRTSAWSELWHRYNEGAEIWERLYQYKNTDVVPESMFTPVNIKYQSEYTMSFKATIRDINGNLVHDVYRLVQSDRLLSLAEWQNAAIFSLLEDMSQYSSEVVALDEIEFYKRII